MSTFTKWLVMLIIWFLVSLAGYFGCVKDCCHDGSAADTEEVTPPPAETPAMGYAVNSKLGYATVETSDGFTAWKDNILAQMQDSSQVLEVTGYYYDSETAPEGYANMGLARADQLIQLLAPFISTDRMRPIARKVDDGEDIGDAYFLAGDTRWVAGEDQEETETTEVVALSANEAIILFPRASVEEVREQSVLDYLDELAEHLKNSTDQVIITGHASKTGDPAINMRLSRKRAERVQQMLLDRGVPAAQISTDYKGDTELRDPGDSDAAHRRNRRAELKVVPSGN